MSGRLRVVDPDSLARPVGYSHGMAGEGRLLFVAGQIGWTREGKILSDDLVAQFGQALDNVLEVVEAAGAVPEAIARMTLYVTSVAAYRQRRKAIGDAYRQRMGKHYPAMTLVEVKSLLEDAAQVEIEATAVL